ncbi:transcriptional regulator, BadM/Rrf2 family [Desulfarculus baarsii DSM 2075]|uniref:Transcriptional regulator, BadM/Rrf2 family n=1 Tax=Desulfarculus baarsii (strain ATCC 33931 / DSM 2075 / LMG 7858 / VKM B-1802 / 2st14) TaxID=644282 RepID=E1QLS5_DESB2|nr:Rrf2 family transcriptional regulator [Desulfarculus baarsii]ADK86510.1 transcriptional regulator, BadM/Rrf2 family [Desulfarculus baarsii DSM 2075]
MKLSTRGRYGVRAMLELAMHNDDGPVPLRNLALRQEISAKYLEQLLIPLKGAGLVKSVRGARGGYQLAADPKDISLYDIVRSLEGPLAPVECVQDAEYCQRVGGCTVHLVWGEMGQLLVDFLSKMSLADMVVRQREKDQICPPDRKMAANS